jgi:imidazolonepropionase-like amidohydrolase
MSKAASFTKCLYQTLTVGSSMSWPCSMHLTPAAMAWRIARGVFARMTPVSQRKALEVFAGTESAYKLAKKYNVKTAFGTDILFDAGAAMRQGAYLAKMVRWYTPAEALKMATADNGELMALSGFINPYPGKLGVVEAGALADLLMVEGNPLENIQLVADPDRNFLIVMKDGTIYKNTLPH